VRVLPRTVLAAAALVMLSAAPAAADPAGPSDFRSEVTGIVPAVEGVSAEIRGGDSFLEISVQRGHEVVVMGYTGEPYLRFDSDGTVERNRLSGATYLNNDRKGRVTVPDRVTQAVAEGADPDWERIGDGGTYAWHDHRVHWMSDASPHVERGERVPGAYDPWKVPVEVDGTAVEVQGTLTYAPATSPLPWAALAVVGVGALAWLGRGRGLRAPALALAAVSVAAVVVGRADWASTPGGGNPLLWALAVVALISAVGATAMARRSAGVILALASVASLSGWALLRFQVLLKPVLPTDLPFAFDRATVALALAASAASAYLAVTSGVLALPALEDD
jgi:hypothetical protein